MHDGVSVEEARADHEREALAAQEPADREHSLEWCRLLLARYGGANQLDEIPLETAGPCDDCTTIVDVRYQVGRYTLCRTHATLRLRARARLEAQHFEQPLRDQPPPADPHAWTVTNAGRYTTSQLRRAFHYWGIDSDLAVELVDLAADLARAAEGQAA